MMLRWCDFLRCCSRASLSLFLELFFFSYTAPTEIYTLSLHDALPIWLHRDRVPRRGLRGPPGRAGSARLPRRDRKSTRLNSSHANISYAVFCLKKKKNSNEIKIKDGTIMRHANYYGHELPASQSASEI